MVPRTDDKRVLFAIPWHEHVIVGTTDTPVQEIRADPQPAEWEIEFLLTHAGRYLAVAPQRQDILSIFAGLRPLAKPATARNTALIPRDHSILVSQSGLITVTGGKWTTYRKMAEQAVDRAIHVGGLDPKPCRTRELRLHGCTEGMEGEPLSVYGSEAAEVRGLAKERPEWGALIHPALPYTSAQVIWAGRNEMARTVEDVLARRTRALFLDARSSAAAAPAVASLLATELGRDAAWADTQAKAYEQLARRYLPG
jgi:glycerol-3-phosphate dehydrogenase